MPQKQSRASRSKPNTSPREITAFRSIFVKENTKTSKKFRSSIIRGHLR